MGDRDCFQCRPRAIMALWQRFGSTARTMPQEIPEGAKILTRTFTALQAEHAISWMNAANRLVSARSTIRPCRARPPTSATRDRLLDGHGELAGLSLRTCPHQSVHNRVKKDSIAYFSGIGAASGSVCLSSTATPPAPRGRSESVSLIPPRLPRRTHVPPPVTPCADVPPAHVASTMVVPENVRVLIVWHVVHHNMPCADAARLFGCDASSVYRFKETYLATGDLWPNGARRDTHHDNTLYDDVLKTAIIEIIEEHPEIFARGGRHFAGVAAATWVAGATHQLGVHHRSSASGGRVDAQAGDHLL